MSNPLENVDIDVIVPRLALLTAMASWCKERADEHRTALYQRMEPGSRITGRNPLDTTLALGSVTMSEPDPEAFISDRDVFDAYCRETYPDEIEVWTEIDPEDDEVIEILRKHAPHLVKVHSSVPSLVKEKALDVAISEEVPGTKRRKGMPQLSVTPAKNAQALVRQMVAGSSVLRELEA